MKIRNFPFFIQITFYTYLFITFYVYLVKHGKKIDFSKTARLRFGLRFFSTGDRKHAILRTRLKISKNKILIHQAPLPKNSKIDMVWNWIFVSAEPIRKIQDQKRVGIVNLLAAPGLLAI